MREIPLRLTDIGMINATRFVIGAGAGLLLADTVHRHTRKAVGITLLAAGVLFSIPVGLSFVGKLRSAHAAHPEIPAAA
jgi:hypothetical protein